MIVTDLPHDLSHTIKKLNTLSDNTSALYALVKRRMQTCKEFKISLIGNPIFHLETEVIQLNYLVLQHISVCKDFQNMNLIQINPIERKKQTYELIAVYKELKDCYQRLRNKSFRIPLRFTNENQMSVCVS